MSRALNVLVKVTLAAFVLLALCVVYLDARITATFTDKMWEIPAKVFAITLELFVCSRLSDVDLFYELSVLG